MIKSDLKKRDGELINNWYIACLSHELKSKKPLRRVIYDVPIVLFRNESKIVALIDKCLHRQVPLSEGNIDGCNIKCPYHGWTFDGNGEVCDIPSEGPEFLQGQSKRKIQSYIAIEQDECIWVWMGKSEPTSLLPPWRFPEITIPQWSHYIMVTDFENEVVNLAENFMDVPHTVYVHKGWFRNESFKKVAMNVKTYDGTVLVTYDQPDDNIAKYLKPLINPKNEPMKHTDHYFFPNITRVDYQFGENYKYIINSQCTPVSTMKSRVYTYIAYKLPFFGKILKPFIHYYTRIVIEQDVDIMEIQSRNLKVENNGKYQSTPADDLHIQIEKIRKLGIEGDMELYNLKSDKTTDIWI